MSHRDGTHSFIVRVWQEPRELAGTRAPWRGSVEHLPGGERHYLRTPGEIAGFVLSYTGPWVAPEVLSDPEAGA